MFSSIPKNALIISEETESQFKEYVTHIISVVNENGKNDCQNTEETPLPRI